jgi:hypothetical protein
MCTSASAHGYTVHSPFTTGCHELITEEALRAVRAGGLAPMLPARDDNERALLADLPFELPPDMNDMGSAALLLGVRKPDVLDHSILDISNLPLVHGDPARQDDHCLRAPADDDPGGVAAAMSACQESMTLSLAHALAGLQDDGRIDPENYDTIRVTLPVRSKTDVKLNRFYVNAGTALHTLQDAFSHTFRDESQEQITTVLNWVDYVEKVGRENRDGPEHRAELDECVNIDLRRRERLTAVINASVDMLTALLQAPDTVGDLVTRATQTQPDCSYDNRWCASADNSYAVRAGCAQAGESPWQVLLVVLMLGRFTWGIRCHSTKRRLPRSSS